MNHFAKVFNPENYWVKYSALLLLMLFINNSAIAQTELWVATDSAYSFNNVKALHVSSYNSVFIIGSGYHSGKPTAVVVKRNSNGGLIWTYKCELFSNDFYFENAMVDESENTYLVGWLVAGSNSDAVIVKVDSRGNNLWNQTLNPSGGSDTYKGVTVDNSGNVYAVGTSSNPGNGDQRIFVTKFSSSGTVQWSQFYSAPDKVAYANEVKIDGNGDIIVAGIIREASIRFKMQLLKYNASGTLIWHQESNQTTPYSYKTFKKALLDGNNNTYFFANLDTFVSGGSSTIKNKGIVIIKVNTSGNIQWMRSYFNSNFNIGNVYSGCINENNEVFFGGNGDSSAVNYGYYAALNPTNGDIIWRKLFRGNSGNGGMVYDLIASSSTLYITGSYGGLGTNDDYYTAKVDKTDGEILWSATYNGFSNSADAASLIALDNAENIFVSGSAREYSPFSNSITTIKYGNLTNIREHNEGNTSVSVYPHPFQSSVTFNIHVPGESSGSFQLIDINGKIVAQSNNISFSKGDNLINLNLSELNSGIYFSNIQTQFGTIRKKIICVK